MEQGPDFWCWFDTTQFSYHCVHPILAKMLSIQILLHFSQIVQRVCTLVLFIRPSIEYGSEVWEGNKSHARSLESIILDGAKRILGCSSKTCNEAVRGDMGLDTLQSRRDRAKLKWWYKLATLPEDRYPKQLFNQEWNIKPRRGRQRKVWSRMVDDLFKSLDIDKGEWLEDIECGDSSSASFLACVEECISERESRRFEEGLIRKLN